MYHLFSPTLASLPSLPISLPYSIHTNAITFGNNIVVGTGFGRITYFAVFIILITTAMLFGLYVPFFFPIFPKRDPAKTGSYDYAIAL